MNTQTVQMNGTTIKMKGSRIFINGSEVRNKAYDSGLWKIAFISGLFTGAGAMILLADLLEII